MLNPYIGHESQLNGVEEYILQGGKGNGMRLLHVWTENGLDMTVSLDRCADVTRIRFKGVNISYFAPCGYVSPIYCEKTGKGFLKGFTAGFFTTCGLSNVGPACIDNGEELPQHGTINSIPVERHWWLEDEESISIHALINDSMMFGKKLLLYRILKIQKKESKLYVIDTVENQGDQTEPLMLLYHMNFGYPFLSEETQLSISSVRVEGCTPYAQENISNWATMPSPKMQTEEQCYQHYFDKEGLCNIYNPILKMGADLSFDPNVFDNLTQWKMPGYRDYVLGLEPGNCTTDGRDIDRKNGILKFLEPGEKKRHKVKISFYQK